MPKNSPAQSDFLNRYVLDENPNTITYQIITQDPNKVQCNINDKSLTYQPAPNFVGTSTCTIKATNEHGLTDNATATINVISNSTTPYCSIAPVNSTVQQGENANFNITFTNFTANPTPSDVSITCNGTPTNTGTTTSCAGTICSAQCTNYTQSGPIQAAATKQGQTATCQANVNVTITPQNMCNSATTGVQCQPGPTCNANYEPDISHQSCNMGGGTICCKPTAQDTCTTPGATCKTSCDAGQYQDTADPICTINGTQAKCTGICRIQPASIYGYAF